MKKISGIVLDMEIDRLYCTVLAPGNHYVKLRLGEAHPQIGEIFEGYPLHTLGQRPVSRIWAYAASILITLVLGTYQVYALTLAPAAYVSLDTSPSIELVLNSNGKVIKTNVYNTLGAEKLKLSPVQDLPVTEAVKTLLTDVADQTSTTASTIAPSATPAPMAKVVVLTYTDSPAISGSDLTQAVVGALQQQNYRGQLLTDLVDLDYRDQANDSQLSSGQQLVHDLAKFSNNPLSAMDLHKSGLDQLIGQHHIDLKTLLDKAPVNGHAPPFLMQIEPLVSQTSSNLSVKQRKQGESLRNINTLKQQTASVQQTNPDSKSSNTPVTSLPTASIQAPNAALPPAIEVSQAAPPPPAPALNPTATEDNNDYIDTDTNTNAGQGETSSSQPQTPPGIANGKGQVKQSEEPKCSETGSQHGQNHSSQDRIPPGHRRRG